MKVEKSDSWQNSLDLNPESRTRNNDVDHGKDKPDTAAAPPKWRYADQAGPLEYSFAGYAPIEPLLFWV